MRFITMVVALAAMLLSGCGYQPPRFLSYDGPEVTRVIVHKDARRMELWHHEVLLESFGIQLGIPTGHKERRGDRRTPEGDYVIDRRNARSRFHLSLGISYPNEDDIARAEAAGLDPGDNIFIHGRGPEFRRARGDWTDGCIAVTDREMERIYAMVRTGTPITILP